MQFVAARWSPAPVASRSRSPLPALHLQRHEASRSREAGRSEAERPDPETRKMLCSSDSQTSEMLHGPPGTTYDGAPHFFRARVRVFPGTSDLWHEFRARLHTAPGEFHLPTTLRRNRDTSTTSESTFFTATASSLGKIDRDAISIESLSDKPGNEKTRKRYVRDKTANAIRPLL